MWDFTEKATLKVSYGESASAINWFPTNANLVAIGTSMGWVRVYDTRTGGQVMSVMANPATRPRKVKGIRFDPFNQNNFVTFSDVPGETVKVWDIRRIVSSKSAVKNAGFLLSIRSEDNFGITGIITDVAWSPARAGVVAVANSHQRCISLFNTVKSNADNSSSSPILSISTSETVKCISWQGISQQHALQSGDVIKAEEILKGNDFEGNNKPTWEPFSVELTDNLATISDSFVSSSPANLLEGSLSFNRMLLTVTGGFIELDLRERVPIAFGGTGKILVAQGKNAIQLDTEKCAKSNDGEYRDSLFDTDWLSKKYRISMEFIMKRRCQLGYSLDASENIEIIAAQLDAVHNAIQLDPTHSLDSQSSVQEFIAITSKVYRVWVWIDRIETLKSGQEGLSLSNCGVLSILRSDGEFSNDIGRNSIETKHEMTGALIYQSKSRNLCKHVCGWTELWGIVNPSRGK